MGQSPSCSERDVVITPARIERVALPVRGPATQPLGNLKLEPPDEADRLAHRRMVNPKAFHLRTTSPLTFFLNLEPRPQGNDERLRMPRLRIFCRFAFAIMGTSILSLARRQVSCAG